MQTSPIDSVAFVRVTKTKGETFRTNGNTQNSIEPDELDATGDVAAVAVADAVVAVAADAVVAVAEVVVVAAAAAAAAVVVVAVGSSSSWGTSSSVASAGSCSAHPGVNFILSISAVIYGQRG
jgi:hypothetical protein